MQKQECGKAVWLIEFPAVNLLQKSVLVAVWWPDNPCLDIGRTSIQIPARSPVSSRYFMGLISWSDRLYRFVMTVFSILDDDTEGSPVSSLNCDS